MTGFSCVVVNWSHMAEHDLGVILVLTYAFYHVDCLLKMDA